MKKPFVFIFVVILCFIMIGCSNKNNTDANSDDIITSRQEQVNKDYSDANGGDQDYFNGKVLAICDKYIKVQCLDVTKGNIEEDAEVEVTKDIVAANDIPDIKINDTVRIVYTGIMETYPLKLQTVFNIYKVDDNGNVIPN